LNFGLETSPVGFQLGLRPGPRCLVGGRLLFDDVPELIALLLQIGESLGCLDAQIGIDLTGFPLKRRQRGIHFVDPLFGPIQKKVSAG
jgi:hypothetical protein